ncbi:MAG: nucleotidyltransferase family protein [Jaaginema sp. PMC 1079.18]|nr:nucleotidyltransferase family protein [Jaaginema sp. PMC 1080.18]MEC4852660.1 nucleotidyltransferase family protein [Jaaginema sp. PMC 1079.18]MEC4864466.1 nucleotidyltransferase family protein [Jaaginema sp. PMC 1078.18]
MNRILTTISIPHAALEQLCRQYHIRKLALFGSVLRDDFRLDSDIDILVEFLPGQTPGFGFIEIQDSLSQLLGRIVDLNTPQDLSRYFRDEVLAEARVIYGEMD